MKSILVILLLTLSVNSLAYVDLGLNYSRSERKVEAPALDDSDEDQGSAKTITEGYTINWAWFIWEYTALELNYSHSTETLIDNREVATADSSITIKEINSTVITEVSGVGIRQSFASRKSAIIPMLSIGYAKYTTSGLSIYTLDVSGTEQDLEIQQDKEVFSSSYAAFSLRFRFTQLLGLTLGAKTIMPDFETSEAENNVTYSAGLSWIF